MARENWIVINVFGKEITIDTNPNTGSKSDSIVTCRKIDQHKVLLESKNYQPLGQAATVEINTKDYKQTADEFINEFDRLKRIALSKNENTKN